MCIAHTSALKERKKERKQARSIQQQRKIIGLTKAGNEIFFFK